MPRLTKHEKHISDIRKNAMYNKVYVYKKYIIIYPILLILLAFSLINCSNINEEKSIYSEDNRVALKILDTCPRADQQNISTEAIIEVLFSKELDPKTVSLSSVLLGSGNALIRGNVFYDSRKVTYITEKPLTENTAYALYFTSGLKDIDGFSLTDEVMIFRFLTGSPGNITCR